MATDHNFKVKNGLVVEGGEIFVQGTSTPQIYFNGSSDTSIDMAIKATPESLDFYEPEDNNKLHMRIVDDAGVNAVFGFRTGVNDGTLRIDGSGNLTNIGTISSGAITVTGGSTQSVIKSSSDAPLMVESTDPYSGIKFKDTDGNSSMYYRGANDHLYLHSAKFSVAGSTIASGYQFQVNGSANLTGSLAIGGVQVIAASTRNLTNIGTISSGAITSSGQIMTTQEGSNSLKSRFLMGKASGSTADGPLYIQYGSADGVYIGAGSGGAGLTVAGTISSGSITSSGTITINQGGSFSKLDIKTSRTGATENIGGVQFYNSSGTQRSQLYGTNDGLLKLATNGTTVALTLDASQNATFAGAITATGTTTLSGLTVDGAAAVKYANSSAFGNQTFSYAAQGFDAFQIYNDNTTSSTSADQFVSLHMRADGAGNASARIVLRNDNSGNGRLYFMLRGGAHTAVTQPKMLITDDGQVTISDNATTYNERLFVDGNLRVEGVYKSGTHTIIDANRNLTNIGTLSTSGKTSIAASTSTSSSSGLKLHVGTINNTGSSAIAQFGGFIRASEYYILHETTGSGNSLFIDYVGNDMDITSGEGTYSGVLRANAYKVGTTTVIDSSRNLTNIGSISSGAITSSGTLNLTSGNIRLRQDISGDGVTIRDIDFLNNATEGTSDDRAAIIRARTSAGTSTTRGGKLLFYTRQANGSGFNETTIDHAGNLVVAGNIYLPQYLYHGGDTNTYIQFTGDRVRIAAGGTVKFDSNNTYQTTAAPSAVSITSSTIISETVEIVFGQSSTSGVSRYEIWSDGGGSDFSLIGKINAQDAASSMSFVDTTFADTGTINYRVYAVRYGIYSTAATTSVSFSQPSLDVTNFSAIADLNNFYLQYEKPDTRFLDHIEIYVDVDASSSNLARSSASLIYSGDNSSYMYTISASDRNNFHQFWVECVGV